MVVVRGMFVVVVVVVVREGGSWLCCVVVFTRVCMYECMYVKQHNKHQSSCVYELVLIKFNVYTVTSLTPKDGVIWLY